MTEQAKLAASLLMSVVGLVLTLDLYRITHIPKQPGGSVGKQIRPVPPRGARPAS